MSSPNDNDIGGLLKAFRDKDYTAEDDNDDAKSVAKTNKNEMFHDNRRDGVKEKNKHEERKDESSHRERSLRQIQDGECHRGSMDRSGSFKSDLKHSSNFPPVWERRDSSSLVNRNLDIDERRSRNRSDSNSPFPPERPKFVNPTDIVRRPSQEGNGNEGLDKGMSSAFIKAGPVLSGSNMSLAGINTKQRTPSISNTTNVALEKQGNISNMQTGFPILPRNIPIPISDPQNRPEQFDPVGEKMHNQEKNQGGVMPIQRISDPSQVSNRQSGSSSSQQNISSGGFQPSQGSVRPAHGNNPSSEFPLNRENSQDRFIPSQRNTPQVTSSPNMGGLSQNKSVANNINTPHGGFQTNKHNSLQGGCQPYQGNVPRSEYQHNQGNINPGEFQSNKGDVAQSGVPLNQGRFQSNQGNIPKGGHGQNNGNATQGGFQSNPGNPIQGGFQPNQGNPIQGGFQPNQGNLIQGGFQPNQGNPVQGGFQSNQGNPIQVGFQPNKGNPNQGGFQPNQGNPIQGGFQPNQGNPIRGAFQPNHGNPIQGGFQPNQGNPNQGGFQPNQGNPNQGGFQPNWGNQNHGGFQSNQGNMIRAGFPPNHGNPNQVGFQPNLGNPNQGGFQPAQGNPNQGALQPNLGNTNQGGFQTNSGNSTIGGFQQNQGNPQTGFQSNQGNPNQARFQANQVNPNQAVFQPNQGNLNQVAFQPNQGNPTQGGFKPNQGNRPQGVFQPNQGDLTQGGFPPNQGNPTQGGFQPNQRNINQGGFQPNVGNPIKEGFMPNQSNAPHGGFQPNLGNTPQNLYQPNQGNSFRDDIQMHRGNIPQGSLPNQGNISHGVLNNQGNTQSGFSHQGNTSNQTNQGNKPQGGFAPNQGGFVSNKGNPPQGGFPSIQRNTQANFLPKQTMSTQPSLISNLTNSTNVGFQPPNQANALIGQFKPQLQSNIPANPIAKAHQLNPDHGSTFSLQKVNNPASVIRNEKSIESPSHVVDIGSDGNANKSKSQETGSLINTLSERLKNISSGIPANIRKLNRSRKSRDDSTDSSEAEMILSLSNDIPIPEPSLNKLPSIIEQVPIISTGEKGSEQCLDTIHVDDGSQMDNSNSSKQSSLKIPIGTLHMKTKSITDINSTDPSAKYDPLEDIIDCSNDDSMVPNVPTYKFSTSNLFKKELISKAEVLPKQSGNLEDPIEIMDDEPSKVGGNIVDSKLQTQIKVGDKITVKSDEINENAELGKKLVDSNLYDPLVEDNFMETDSIDVKKDEKIKCDSPSISMTRKITFPCLSKEQARKRLKGFNAFSKEKMKAKQQSSEAFVDTEKDGEKIDDKNEESKKKKLEEKKKFDEKKKKSGMSEIEKIREENTVIKEMLDVYKQSLPSTPEDIVWGGFNMLLDPKALQKYAEKGKQLREMQKSKSGVFEDCDEVEKEPLNEKKNEEQNIKSNKKIETEKDLSHKISYTDSTREISEPFASDHARGDEEPAGRSHRKYDKRSARNWNEYKGCDSDPKLSSKLDFSPSRRRDRSEYEKERARVYFPYYLCPKDFSSLKARRFDGNNYDYKRYPAHLVQYTGTRPSISYSVNPRRYIEMYISRNQSFRHNKSGTVIDMMEDVWNCQTTHQSYEKNKVMERLWYLPNWIETSDEENIELHESRPISALDILGSNYKLQEYPLLYQENNENKISSTTESDMIHSKGREKMNLKAGNDGVAVESEGSMIGVRTGETIMKEKTETETANLNEQSEFVDLNIKDIRKLLQSVELTKKKRKSLKRLKKQLKQEKRVRKEKKRLKKEEKHNLKRQEKISQGHDIDGCSNSELYIADLNKKSFYSEIPWQEIPLREPEPVVGDYENQWTEGPCPGVYYATDALDFAPSSDKMNDCYELNGASRSSSLIEIETTNFPCEVKGQIPSTKYVNHFEAEMGKESASCEKSQEPSMSVLTSKNSSKSYKDESNNHSISHKREIGSEIKPIPTVKDLDVFGDDGKRQSLSASKMRDGSSPYSPSYLQDSNSSSPNNDSFITETQIGKLAEKKEDILRESVFRKKDYDSIRKSKEPLQTGGKLVDESIASTYYKGVKDSHAIGSYPEAKPIESICSSIPLPSISHSNLNSKDLSYEDKQYSEEIQSIEKNEEYRPSDFEKGGTEKFERKRMYTSQLDEFVNEPPLICLDDKTENSGFKKISKEDLIAIDRKAEIERKVNIEKRGNFQKFSSVNEAKNSGDRINRDDSRIVSTSDLIKDALSPNKQARFNKEISKISAYDAPQSKLSSADYNAKNSKIDDQHYSKIDARKGSSKESSKRNWSPFSQRSPPLKSRSPNRSKSPTRRKRSRSPLYTQRSKSPLYERRFQSPDRIRMKSPRRLRRSKSPLFQSKFRSPTRIRKESRSPPRKYSKSPPRTSKRSYYRSRLSPSRRSPESRQQCSDFYEKSKRSRSPSPYRRRNKSPLHQSRSPSNCDLNEPETKICARDSKLDKKESISFSEAIVDQTPLNFETKVEYLPEKPEYLMSVSSKLEKPDTPSPDDSPQRPSLSERLREELGVESDKQQPDAVETVCWDHPSSMTKASENSPLKISTEKGGQVVRRGNFLEILPQGSPEKIIDKSTSSSQMELPQELANDIDNEQVLNSMTSSNDDFEQNKIHMNVSDEIQSNSLLLSPPKMVPAPSLNQPVINATTLISDAQSMLENQPVSSPTPSNADAPSNIAQTALESLNFLDPQQQQAVLSAAVLAAAQGISPGDLPIAQLISILQMQQQVVPNTTETPEEPPVEPEEQVQQMDICTTPDPEPQDKEESKPSPLKVKDHFDREAFRRERQKVKERKKQEKEARREAKRQRYLEKKREIEMQRKASEMAKTQENDEDEDDLSTLKEAMFEVPEMGSPVPDYEVEEEEEDEDGMRKHPLPQVPLPEPEKGILHSPTYRSMPLYRLKSVSFADGIMPGQGSSGEEEIEVIPYAAKLDVAQVKQVKKTKKKKRIKSKLIKMYDPERFDGVMSSPPPPPLSPPPPDVLQLYPGSTHYTQTGPGKFLIYTLNLDKGKEAVNGDVQAMPQPLPPIIPQALSLSHPSYSSFGNLFKQSPQLQAE